MYFFCTKNKMNIRADSINQHIFLSIKCLFQTSLIYLSSLSFVTFSSYLLIETMNIRIKKLIYRMETIFETQKGHDLLHWSNNSLTTVDYSDFIKHGQMFLQSSPFVSWSVNYDRVSDKIVKGKYSLRMNTQWNLWEIAQCEIALENCPIHARDTLKLILDSNGGLNSNELIRGITIGMKCFSLFLFHFLSALWDIVTIIQKEEMNLSTPPMAQTFPINFTYKRLHINCHTWKTNLRFHAEPLDRGNIILRLSYRCLNRHREWTG